MTNLVPPRPGTFGTTPTFGPWYDKFVARSIQWMTATRDQYGKWHDSPVNHAVVFVGEVPGYDKPQLVEARPGGASLHDWDEYADIHWANRFKLKSGSSYVPYVLSEWQRQHIAHTALMLADNKVGYGYRDYLAIALAQQRLGYVINPAKIDNKIERWVLDQLSRPDRLICSQLVDYCYQCANVELFDDKRPTGLVSPADLYALTE